MAADLDGKKLKLFISYSRRDMAFVDRLVAGLEARDFDVLIDRRDLPALEDWKRELLGFIRRADTIVFVVSPASIASNVCSWEVDQVKALSKRLAPIVIGDIANVVVPEDIAKINYLYFSDGSALERQLDLLAEALNTDRGWIQEHTRVGEIARRWDERRFPNALLLRGRELDEAEIWLGSRPRLAPEPPDTIRTFIFKSRSAARRRQRMTLAAALAVSLVTTGLAALAYVQTVERTRILTQTVGAATEMVRSASSIRGEVGVPSKAILSILAVPDRSLANIAEQTRQIPEAVRAFAALDYEICEMNWEAGQLDVAKGRCQRGVDRLDELQRGSPLSPADRQLLARLLRMSAFIAHQGGDEQAVAGLLHRRDGILKELPGASEDDPAGTIREARALFDEAYTNMFSRERLPVATEKLEKAHRLLSDVLERDPLRNEVRIDLSSVENRLVEAALLTGQPEKALAYARASVAKMDRVAETSREYIEVWRHQAHALDGLARAALRNGELAEAAAVINRLDGVASKLATADTARVDLIAFRPVADMRKGTLAKAEGKDDAWKVIKKAHEQFMVLHRRSPQATLRILLLDNAESFVNDAKAPSQDVYAVLQDKLEIELGALSSDSPGQHDVEGIVQSTELKYVRFKESGLRPEIVRQALSLGTSNFCTRPRAYWQIQACMPIADLVRNQVGSNAASEIYRNVLAGLQSLPATADKAEAAGRIFKRGVVNERICQIGLELLASGAEAERGIEKYCAEGAQNAGEWYESEKQLLGLDQQALRYSKAASACLLKQDYDCVVEMALNGWAATRRLFLEDANYNAVAAEGLLGFVTIVCTVGGTNTRADEKTKQSIVVDLQSIALRRTIDKGAKDALAAASKACIGR